MSSLLQRCCCCCGRRRQRSPSVEHRVGDPDAIETARCDSDGDADGDGELVRLGEDSIQLVVNEVFIASGTASAVRDPLRRRLIQDDDAPSSGRGGGVRYATYRDCPDDGDDRQEVEESLVAERDAFLMSGAGPADLSDCVLRLINSAREAEASAGALAHSESLSRLAEATWRCLAGTPDGFVVCDRVQVEPDDAQAGGGRNLRHPRDVASLTFCARLQGRSPAEVAEAAVQFWSDTAAKNLHGHLVDKKSDLHRTLKRRRRGAEFLRRLLCPEFAYLGLHADLVRTRELPAENLIAIVALIDSEPGPAIDNL